MWNDIYLNLPDEATWLLLAPDPRPDMVADVLGVKRNAEDLPQGGFLVNLRLHAATPLPAQLEAYVIAEPAFPQRQFAG